MRTSNHHQASALAVMSQFVGFLMAATVPFALGSAYEWMHDWSVLLAVYAIVGGVLQTIVGYGTGRGQARI